MSEYEQAFKAIIANTFGSEHDKIEMELSGFNMLLDRIEAWKNSKVQDDRDFARWLLAQMIKNCADRL